MKIIISPDSYKGSMTALNVAESIEKGIKKASRDCNVNCEVIKLPMADGGEGTVDAILNSVNGEKIHVKVKDPLGREINSFFGIIDDNTAIIEMAAASGLSLLTEEERNPMETTSYGTGQLIKEALNYGCKNIIIGIGGSATNDGGVGMAQALGVQFLDKYGEQVGPGGGQLNKIAEINTLSMDHRIKNTTFTIASDVENVLCGPNGASAIYGPQKGATSEMVNILDNNLRHLAKIIKRDLKKDILNMPGSGAAGGLGAALIAFLNAKCLSGIDTVMQLTNFEEKVKSSDLIITGEGSTDYQTMFGKVPYGVAKIARRYNKTVIVISGSLKQGYEELYKEGITALFSIVNGPITLRESIERGEELLAKTTRNIMRLVLKRE